MNSIKFLLALVTVLIVFPAISQDLPKVSQPGTFFVGEQQIPVSDNEFTAEYFRRYNYNFGSVRVGRVASTTFYLTAGNFPMRIQNIYLVGSSFWMYTNCPNILFPRRQCYIHVRFSPQYVGSASGYLNVNLYEGLIQVNLWGRGY